MGKRGKEVKMVNTTSKDTKVEGRDPYASQNKKEEVKSLREQLDDHFKLLEGKEVVGYSILFSGGKSTEKKGVVTHGMATTYPNTFNHLLLGFHTGLLSDEEMAILEVIGATVGNRILKQQEEIKDNGEGKEVETEDNSGPRKIS